MLRYWDYSQKIGVYMTRCRDISPGQSPSCWSQSSFARRLAFACLSLVSFYLNKTRILGKQVMNNVLSDVFLFIWDGQLYIYQDDRTLLSLLMSFVTVKKWCCRTFSHCLLDFLSIRVVFLIDLQKKEIVGRLLRSIDDIFGAYRRGCALFVLDDRCLEQVHVQQFD